MKTSEPRPVKLRHYRPAAFHIEKVDLDISLHATATRVKSKMTIAPNPKSTAKTTRLRLDGGPFELEAVLLNGKPLRPQDFRRDNESLTLPKVPKRRFQLEIVNTVNPSANSALQGLYRSRGTYCTQCEAEGFREITYFIDRPDNLAVFTTRIEADIQEAPILLGNGNPLERGSLDRGKRHYAVWHDPHPKPSYLFAVVGGNLSSIASTFTTMSGRKVDLRIFVEPGKEDRAGWAMDALKRSMKWDEEHYGREYDLDVFNIVAVSDFNMGAMENKGLNVFNDRLILASDDTATDWNFAAIESVVAHEYFHNWTGNRITCRDWFQLCLKEGLTVFRDQEFSATERSRPVQRISDVRQLRAHQFPEDEGPLAHPVRPDQYIEINNFYTATVYEKGAEIIRMIQAILGPATFRKGMDIYFARHDGDAATVEQFIKCFEEAYGRSLAQLFRWYGQSGTPEIVCTLDHDAKKATATLTAVQVHAETAASPKKKPVHIPLKVGLIGPDGSDMDLKFASGEAPADGYLHLSKTTQTFKFIDIAERPIPSLLRGFSAPVKLNYEYTDHDLAFLMANDSDLFNRWQAANTYATRTIIELVQTNKADRKPSQRGKTYADALATTISRMDLEPAYRAEILRLPSESDIAREIGHDVDPAAIHSARIKLLKLIGRRLASAFVEIYASMTDKGQFSPDAESAGRRALRNMALTYLWARGKPEDITRLERHFYHATNMTDKAHALDLLARTKGEVRQKALDAFYDSWHRDHVVIDTWFAVQALGATNATLNLMRKLVKHPLYSIAAPNKVRALIGTFAMHNPVQFNRPDGKGYAFMAEQILALDARNPQLAARLLSSFKSWRALEQGRSLLARDTLRRVAKAPKLSKDSYEIVTKMLE